MSQARLYLQKRPSFGPIGWLAHIGIVIVLSLRYGRWCPYSHGELEIDGVFYSSTTGSGVRQGRRDIDPKDWDVFEAPGVDVAAALERFNVIEWQGYDWLGAVSWAIPFARHRPGRYSCFEAVAAMLGLPDAHRQGPLDLIAYVKQ